MALSIIGNFSPMPKWSVLGSSSPREVRFRVKGFFLVKKLAYFPANTHGHIWNYHFRWPRLRYTSNKIVGMVVGRLGWSTGTVTDTNTDGHEL